MKKVQVFHNTRCGKSREALALLTKAGYEVEIIEYLKQVPTKKELKLLLSKLGLKAIDIVRKKEGLFLEKFKNKQFTNEEWIQLLQENPILIERPIVINGYRAIVARPPELALDIL